MARVLDGSSKVAIRHKKMLLGKDAVAIAMSKASIRRLARRGGVRRISFGTYDSAREAVKDFLTDLIRDSATYAEHARRKTVTAKDVCYALKRKGKKLYGFGV